MGILDNLDKVAYSTVFPTDKIVFTQSGSFVHTTGTDTRTYDYFGFPLDVERYIIRHGFDRPVFIEGTWSADGVTDSALGGNSDGSAQYALAYSDSTNIYIECYNMSSGTTVQYEIICSWIDDYDSSDPSLEPFNNLPDTYTQVFNSRSTIPVIVKQGVLGLSTTSGSFTNVLGTVPHGMSFAPNPKVFFEAFSGEVWPLNYGGGTNPYLSDTDQVECNCFVDSTNLIINAIMKSGNGTRRFWYKLYTPVGNPQTGGYTVS